MISFSIERPNVLFAILAIVPVGFFVLHRFKNLSRIIAGFYDGQSESKVYRKIRKTLVLRTFFRCLSWIFAVCAYAGFSWGTRNVPVQKNGSTVCFVFDISWSMMAKDCPENLTRLEASKLYAQNLIARLDKSSFSAVLAKGDGFVAIPETEDSAAMLSLLENLSPSMMTSPGTSLGKGVQTALHSLSLNSAKLNYIWIFTDGDETDSHLKESLEEAAKYGIPVTLIGFGNEAETEITTGDGTTTAMTALRSSNLKEMAQNVSRRNYSLPGRNLSSNKNLIRYVDSRVPGSAYELLDQIKTKHSEKDSEDIFSYEVVPVKRHSLFIVLAIVFFLASFVAGELNIHNKALITGAALCITLFTSCGEQTQRKKEILKGSWNWYQGKYRAATADFLKTELKSEKDSMAEQYAHFGLAATYISIDEYDAALDRIDRMQLGTDSVPDDLKSAAFYNKGIIFQRKNDYIQAADYFKKAILANPGNIDAKINLELCNRQLEEKNGAQGESEMQKVSEGRDDSAMQNEIFNLIRENDDKQWKKMESNQKKSSVLDY